MQSFRVLQQLICAEVKTHLCMSQIVSTKLQGKEEQWRNGCSSSTSTLSLGHRLLLQQQKIDTQEIQDAKKTPYFKATSKHQVVPLFLSEEKKYPPPDLVFIPRIFFSLQLSNHNLWHAQMCHDFSTNELLKLSKALHLPSN